MDEKKRHAFETTVFAELVKRCGREAVFYWMTKDKKEIFHIGITPTGSLIFVDK